MERGLARSCLGKKNKIADESSRLALHSPPDRIAFPICNGRNSDVEDVITASSAFLTLFAHSRAVPSLYIIRRGGLIEKKDATSSLLGEGNAARRGAAAVRDRFARLHASFVRRDLCLPEFLFLSHSDIGSELLVISSVLYYYRNREYCASAKNL